MNTRTSATRPAAVAGYFYPGAPEELRTAVAGMLKDAGAPRAAAPKAIIVPHAGYIYSGAIAAHAYAALAPAAETIRRIVMLGPAHRVYVRGLAAPSVASFATPLGPVQIDRAAIDAVANLPQVVIDDTVHEAEHSLEVQLPFLKRVAPHAALTPFAVGDVSVRDVAEVLERLWGGPETRVVISSDLSHYLPYDRARTVDSHTAGLIEAFEGDAIGPEQACGCRPIAGLLATAKRHGLKIDRLDLRNSGDTAGDKNRVVGYGAWALYAP